MDRRGFIHFAEAQPRTIKEMIVLIGDIILALAAMWLAYTLRLEQWHVPNSMQAVSYGLAVGIFVPIFLVTRQYRVVFRYVSVSMLQNLAVAVVIYSGLFTFTLSVIVIDTVPRSVGLLQPVIFLILISSSRIFIGAWLNRSAQPSTERRCLIYGAGAAGSQLASALNVIGNDTVVGFLDDDLAKQSRRLLNLQVYAPSDWSKLAKTHDITDILLALPSVSIVRRREIIENLSKFQVRVSTMPGLGDLVANRGELIDTAPLSLDDILPREAVDRNIDLSSVKGKSVLVTGAGGSIGSEICRQLLTQGLVQLILLDHSELNLYQIDAEIRQRVEHDGLTINIVTILADIRNADRMQNLFQNLQPNIVFHAAAYKHVPLVEANPGEAISNNFLGTQQVADLAIEYKAERFILISTDKAVRPTNVMGASKRLAELIVQSNAVLKTDTIFAMVRFGNVIGSSGSAIPLFQRQIARGGPVTVTDPEVTRYFMSIPEAVTLVLEAGEMARGGEMFVLDMGEPIKIIDLVRRMIKLSGRQEKSVLNPFGDIEIAYIGLRPGEKMYEELVLGANLVETANPRIAMAEEAFLDKEILEGHKAVLKKAIRTGDAKRIKAELSSMNILVQN